MTARRRPSVVFAAAVLVVTVAFFGLATAEEQHNHHAHHGDSGAFDRDGMVMNSNIDVLPKDCTEVSADLDIEVRVGRAYSRRGLTFGYNKHEWVVPPCSRLTVTLINEDQVRHQWTVHGLPRYLYPQGMFHLEVNGKKQKTGTFNAAAAPTKPISHTVILRNTRSRVLKRKSSSAVGPCQASLGSVPSRCRTTMRQVAKRHIVRAAVA